MDILDLRILKVITSDKVKAVDFSYNFDHTLFTRSSQEFARMVVDFLKSFRSLPTRRTLSDRYKNVTLVNKWFDAIDNLDYDFNDYTYDLEHAKTRFETFVTDDIKLYLDQPDETVASKILKHVGLKLQQAEIIRAGRSHTQKSAGEYLQEFENRYTAKQTNAEESVAIKTGYSSIDKVTGGFCPAELIMFGSETAGGKSMILNNISIQMWMQGNTIYTPYSELKKGYSVLFFSLEMPYEDCFTRFMARLASVPQRSITDANLDNDEKQRVAQASEFIRNYEKLGGYFGIVDVPRNVTIEEIELRYNDALLTYRPDIVVVDYMGLMHSRAFAKDQDFIRMGAISESLHEFGRAYNVVMLTAHQLTDIKRGSASQGEEDRKRVGVHRWGRSSLIMHNVNFGVQIETRPNEQVYPDMKIHFVKNRKGPLGQGTLLKDFAKASILDIPMPDDVPDTGVNNIQDIIKRIQNSGDN